jgi:predicted pyridoxine 5'-phosphate oxidase superfamily flavin-nucleotide-binding protein
VAEASVGAIALRIEQGYGNCPKYISQRPWNPELFTGDYVQQQATEISPAVAQLIRRSDTFFIASSSGPAQPDGNIQAAAWGADISHRGGEPGFLQVAGNVLSFADYPGNNLFNTLGNLQQYPRCGLLLIDFSHGEVVQIAGYAELQQDPQTQRFGVTVEVSAVRHWARLDLQQHPLNNH